MVASKPDPDPVARVLKRQLVSLRDLAIEWSCSRQTVRRVLDRGEVAPVYLAAARNGSVRFRREEVDDLLRRSRSHPKKP